MKRAFLCLYPQRLSLSRRACSVNESHTHTHASSSAQPRSFEEIPEPKGLPLIGTLLDYTPLRGFKTTYIHELWIQRHKDYGDIFKEKMPMTKDYTIFCHSSEDTEIMFRSEGRAPIRPKIEAISFLDKAFGLGESFGNMAGEDWYRHRQVVNRPLLNTKMVWKYVKEQQDVCKDFVKLIRKSLDEKGEIEKFDGFLDRLALEMSGTFLLHSRLGLVSDSPNAKMQELFEGMSTCMTFLGNSIGGLNLWKYTTTKESRKVLALSARMYSIMRELVEEKKHKGGLNDTVLGQFLSEGDLSDTERLSLVYGVIFGSVETTAKAAALIIYCLASNPESQEKLRNEVLALPNNRELTGRTIDGMKFLNALIKESIRLYPLAHMHTRIFEEEIILSGYHIPAGTCIFNTSNSSQNRNPNYFTDPDKFMPERWMEGRDNVKKFGLTGPFGIGARACPGRRFAMQEIRILLIELLKNFRIEYHYKPIVSILRASGFPSEEPKFRFIPLEESRK